MTKYLKPYGKLINAITLVVMLGVSCKFNPASFAVQPTPTPSATPAAGSTRVSEKDGMVMVYIPAGEFWMGAADTDSDAK